MTTTMAFSIANKHGVGITTMTAAPKKANISKNNRKTTAMSAETTARPTAAAKQQSTGSKQQAAIDNHQGIVGPTSAGRA